MHEVGAVLRGRLHVQDRVLRLVVDVDELGGVLGLGRGAGHDDGDALTGERHPADGQHRALRRLLVRVIGHAQGRPTPSAPRSAAV